MKVYMIKYKEWAYGTYSSETLYAKREDALSRCEQMNEEEDNDEFSHYYVVEVEVK